MGKANEQSLERSLDSLRFNLGEQIIRVLEDPEVLEVLVNPDKTLWVAGLARVGIGCAMIGGASLLASYLVS